MQQENDRESTLPFNSKLFKMVNSKGVDREPNTLVINFLEMSTSSKAAVHVANKNAIRISLCTRGKRLYVI